MSTAGALAVLVVALALGAGAWRVGTAASSPVRQLPIAERGFAVLAFGFVALSAWGVVLAQTRSFSLALFLATPALVALALAATWTAARPPASAGSGVSAARGGREATLQIAGVVLLLAVSWWHFMPPFDVRLEARDPGVYHHAGVTLARSGAINWTDDAIVSLEPDVRRFYFPRIGRPGLDDANRFLGFYVQDVPSGLVVPQAFPVFPVWVAVGHSVGGLAGALATGPWLSAFGVLALMFLGWRLYGASVGLAAGAFLATDLAQGWHARYGAAEAAAQVLLLSGFYAWLLFRRHRDPFFGLLAAAALGMAPLAKAELVLLYAPLAVVLVADTVLAGHERRSWTWFWVPLCTFGMFTLAYAYGWSWPYFHDLLQQARVTPDRFGVFFFAALTVGALLVGALGRVGGRMRALARAVLAGSVYGTGAVRVVGSVALIGLAGYAAWVRPYEDSLSWNLTTLPELAALASPWVAALAVLGLALEMARGGRPGAGPLVFTTALLGTLGMYNRQIIPLLLWAYRRWLALVLPMTYLFAAAAAIIVGAWLGRRLARGVAARGVAVAAVGVLALPTLMHHVALIRPYLEFVELPGAAAALSRLDALIDADALVFTEPRTDRGIVRFEAALAYGLGRRVVRLDRADIDRHEVRAVLAAEQARGHAVYLFTTGYVNGIQTFTAEPVEEIVFDSSRMAEINGVATFASEGAVRLPVEAEPMRIVARLYRLSPGGSLPPLPRRVVDGELRGELDVGVWDDRYLVGELVDRPGTESGGWNARWTFGKGVFLLAGIAPDAEEIVIRARANRLATDQLLEVWLDGYDLGEIVMGGERDDYRFRIPERWRPAANHVARVELRTPTVVPADVLPGSTDIRRLGIQVDRVYWTRALVETER